MQRMISHKQPLPACRNGHPPRHINDLRRASAGGGHSIECRCSRSKRHEEYDEALLEWCREHGHPTPAIEQQRPLPLGALHLRATA
jgi:hypothetical protein